MTRLAEKTSAAARLWKCKRSTPPQCRASFKDIQTDSDVMCAIASEHDWPLVESRGRRTSALCQSHRQRPAGSRHVTCTRRWCLCRLLHLARLLRGREGGRGWERERDKQSCSVSGSVKMLCSGLIKGQSGHLTSNRTDASNVKEGKTVS